MVNLDETTKAGDLDKKSFVYGVRWIYLILEEVCSTADIRPDDYTGRQSTMAKGYLAGRKAVVEHLEPLVENVEKIFDKMVEAERLPPEEGFALLAQTVQGVVDD